MKDLAESGMFFESLKLPVSEHFHAGSRMKDCQRVKYSNRKATDKVSKAKKNIGAQRKGLFDQEAHFKVPMK